MASSSSCQLSCFLSPCRQLKYSSSSSRQLKCFLSPTRRLKYSSSSSRQLKYSFSPSRPLKYFSSPCCQLEDSSSASSEWEYHVFLSFRFETRHNFTTQLLQDLKDNDMSVFFDEHKLKKGEDFLLQLCKAIQLSKLSIIILSADYAKSDICLTELSNIMDRRRNQQHMVLPIFYHVDPSDVQNPDGSFKTFFAEHESKNPLDEVNKWKAAFTEVGKLDGIHIKGDKDDKPETEHIKHIVEYAIHKLMKHQVFLSIGEDTRLKFSSHLLKALKDTGINVVSDKGDQFSQAIAVSDLSIIVLSENYVSSESCSAQLSGIMELKRTQKHIILPIFYHINPSHVPKLCGSQWEKDFAEVTRLQGFSIRVRSDRHDYEHIIDIVQCVIKELNRKSRRVSDDFVGIDDQKDEIGKLIKQEDKRIIGLCGIGGIGKSTLAKAVYNEFFSDFDNGYFLRDVSQKTQKQGKESLRNKLLSKLLRDKVDIDTPGMVPFFIRERMETKRVIVVLDNVSDSDQIKCMCLNFFKARSKIIVTSRDRQVLRNGGADEIYEVKKLNENDSLQLFYKFAFKISNPTPGFGFRDLSYKFLGYAQGIPFALKVLGSNLYTKPQKVWESELESLKDHPEPTIFTRILKSSYDDLKVQEQNMFVDIACFFKGEPKENVEEILSYFYQGAVSGIDKLLDKCLLDIEDGYVISMHDLLEEMGKKIACQDSEDPTKFNRLWRPEDVNEVLKCNEVNESIKGIKLHMNDVEDLQLFWFYGFKNILNLRYIDFQTKFLLKTDGLLAKLTGSVSLPDELRYLRWTFYPFTSLSQSFNPKELVVLKLSYSNIQQLWNERYQDLVNLRTIDLQECSTLRKIPNLRGAINLRNLICRGCDGLVDLSYLSHLTSLENLDLTFCINLRRMPNLLGAINLKTLVCCGCESLVQLSELPDNVTKLDLSVTGIEEVADSIQHLVGLRELNLSFTRVENVLSNISKLESLRRLDLSYCERLKTLQELPQYLWRLDASGCMSLEKVSFTDHNFNSLHSLHDGDDAPQEEHSSMLFSNCRSLSQDSIKNISANAILQIQSLSQRWIRREGISREEPILDSLLCCFPGNEVSANEFEHRSENSWLNLKISPIGSSRSKFLVFCICLVADLTLAERNVAFFGKYQLTAASGEKLTGVCMVDETFHRASHGNGDHVFILFSKNMIRIDKDYKEASFEFHAENDNGEEFKLEKCGVHVFYVDAESYTITEMRHGDEGRFGNDSEGGATCHPNA